MLINKTIIIPLSTPLDWSADYIRQTALVLKTHNKVIIYDQTKSHFFLKKIKAKGYPEIENVIIYQPEYLIPFRKFKFIEKLNRILSFYLLIYKYRNKEKILWIFDPEYYDFAKIKAKKLVSLYDCVDFHSSINPRKERLIREKEKQLIKNVDIFTVNSDILYNLHKRASNKVKKLRAQGFCIPEKQLVKESKKLAKKPLIGLMGALNYRLDFGLLNKLVTDNPNWQFLFCGPIQKFPLEDKLFRTEKNITSLLNKPNVKITQAKSRQKVFSVIGSFDIAIIPYNIQIDFNRYCYPMKLYEYFFMGKPVICTPIIELMRFKFRKYIRVGGKAEDWQRQIKSLISKHWPDSYKKAQRKMAIENSWDIKIEQISEFIE